MATSGLIYLDYNATTPLAPEVKAAITASMELFGNPSSGHALGVASKQAFEAARASVARLVGAKSPEEVVLLSCGTESINYCLRGAMHAARDVWGGDHLVISAVEHDAVLATARHLEQAHGFALTVVPVDEFGLVTPAAVAAAVTPKTVLVSIMHSNNEVGTINDIAGIAAALRAARPGPKAAAFLASLDGGAGGGGGGGGGAGAGAGGDAPPPILLHSDASQSLGKVAVDATALGVDYLTVTGHKLYGPKGIGALYVKASSAVSPNGGGSGAATLPLRKLIHGAGHEGGRRAGTESTLLAAGLGAAADLAVAALAADAVAEAAAATAGATAEEGGAGPAPSVGLAVCRDRLEKRLLEGLGPDRVRLALHIQLLSNWGSIGQAGYGRVFRCWSNPLRFCQPDSCVHFCRCSCASASSSSSSSSSAASFACGTACGLVVPPGARKRPREPAAAQHAVRVLQGAARAGAARARGRPSRRQRGEPAATSATLPPTKKKTPLLLLFTGSLARWLAGSLARCPHSVR